MRIVLRKSFVNLGMLIFLNALVPVCGAQTSADKINWPAYQDQAVDLMRQYLRINT